MYWALLGIILNNNVYNYNTHDLFLNLLKLMGKSKLKSLVTAAQTEDNHHAGKNIQKGIRTSISFVHIFMVICITYCCISGRDIDHKEPVITPIRAIFLLSNQMSAQNFNRKSLHLSQVKTNLRHAAENGRKSDALRTTSTLPGLSLRCF